MTEPNEPPRPAQPSGRRPAVGRGATPGQGGLHLRPADGGTLVPVRVVPRSSRNAFDGVTEGELRIRLTAPPVDGAANAALIDFLAGQLDVPRSLISLIGSTTGRHKTILVRGLDPDTVRRRLPLA